MLPFCTATAALPAAPANANSTRTRSTSCIVPERAFEPDSGQRLSWLSTVVPEPRSTRFVAVSRERIVADTPTSTFTSAAPTSVMSLWASAVPSWNPVFSKRIFSTAVPAAGTTCPPAPVNTAVVPTAVEPLAKVVAAP